MVAASQNETSGLEIAAAGPAIGTRNRWLSPASVAREDGEIWAVHTPHIGGVLRRYRAEGYALVAERMATGLTDHHLGARDLDVSARVGPWLLLPTQDWRRAGALDTRTGSLMDATPDGAPILQAAASASRESAILLTDSRMGLS